MMGVAQSVGAIDSVVWLPVIMAQYPFEPGQYAHIIHSICSPFFVRVIGCPEIIGYAMQPVSFATDIDARFIRMCKT